VSAAPRDDEAAAVVLAEPVRQRLIQIAADVVGRLPADEVPAALRTVARFAPAKRQRLGATALSAALDADADFRSRVADVVSAASPALAEAVRARTPTAASDPIDTAVVAYLTRPDGWTEVLADAIERWARERGPSGGTEIERLRKELAGLRSLQKAEAARTRDALASATADLSADLAELARQLRARTAELRTAERGRDDAAAAAHELARASEAASAAHEIELRRLRGRITELERSAESGRRASRIERDVDDARLWLLVETVTDAAAGIRRALALPPPVRRPGDTVSVLPADAGSGRTAADPADLDRLLAVPNLHMIVDGYNVTKTGYGQLPLADQRTRLVAALAGVAARAARAGLEITVAFDGAAKPPAAPRAPRGVRVLFSAADEIADDLIRRLIAAEPAGRPLVVVTSDQQVVADARRAGAWTAPSAVLLACLDGTPRKLS
jgi:predicted RNA-binding protein with PIN domain